MGNMTISTGKGASATSVQVNIPEPTTFDDPQWAEWNCSEADICALAVRQIRVDVANGGARDELREAVKRGVKGAALVKVAQDFIDAWKRGAQKGGRKVLDARGMGLSAKQIAHFEAKGFTVLTDN